MQKEIEAQESESKVERLHSKKYVPDSVEDCPFVFEINFISARVAELTDPLIYLLFFRTHA
jgi:hypothetical protein